MSAAAIAITGGAACGKSLVCEELISLIDGEGYNADAMVGKLLASDSDVQSGVARLLNRASYRDTPEERAALREATFSNPTLREQLEDLLHPRIRVGWQAGVAGTRKNGARHFVAEIPLLYEIGLDGSFDVVLVVAASDAVQRRRLVSRNLDPSTIEGLLKAQLPLATKIAAASCVIWNDGERITLERQVQAFARLVTFKYPNDGKS